MNTQMHTGMDFFFSNMSNKEAKRFVQVLNSMKRTMNGEPLQFKVNRKHPRYLQHQKGTAVVTARYKGVTCNAAGLVLGLEANRKWCESYITASKSRAVYEGSEFYVEDCDVKTL